MFCPCQIQNWEKVVQNFDENIFSLKQLYITPDQTKLPNSKQRVCRFKDTLVNIYALDCKHVCCMGEYRRVNDHLLSHTPKTKRRDQRKNAEIMYFNFKGYLANM